MILPDELIIMDNLVGGRKPIAVPAMDILRVLDDGDGITRVEYLYDGRPEMVKSNTPFESVVGVVNSARMRSIQVIMDAVARRN